MAGSPKTNWRRLRRSATSSILQRFRPEGPDLPRQRVDHANIVEGFERNSDREFIRFLRIASLSGAEVRSHLFVAIDQKYISPAEFARLSKDTAVVGKQIGSLIAYLQECLTTGDRGPGTGDWGQNR